MSCRKQISRLTNIGVLLATAILVTLMGDFTFAMTSDELRIPYFFQLITADDLAWSLKMSALCVIAFVLTSLEDII